MSQPVKRRRPARRKFHVHVYPIVRIKLQSIMARSRRDAIQQAIDRLSPELLYSRFDSDNSGYAEEFSHFLVDLASNREKGFRQSRWYHSREEPLIQLLKKLVDWHSQPRQDPRQLNRIIAEARKALRVTV